MGIYFLDEIVNGSFTAEEPWFTTSIEITNDSSADAALINVVSIIDNNETIEVTFDDGANWIDFARDANSADRLVSTTAGVKEGDKINFRTKNASSVKLARFFQVTGVTA